LKELVNLDEKVNDYNQNINNEILKCPTTAKVYFEKGKF
jgi:hypothetical protein